MLTPSNQTPGATAGTDSTPRRTPKVVNWIAFELGLVSFAALALSFAVRSPDVPMFGLPVKDLMLLHCIYALCWGSLGACLNATLALAKHCAARDFNESWNWWYFTKPPMGAIIGLVSLILTKGLGAAMGTSTDVTKGFGVAALAFVAGFATERVVNKIEDLSKTLFATTSTVPSLFILEPVQGQAVAGQGLSVVVQTAGNITYLTANCNESPTAPVTLTAKSDGQYRADVSLEGTSGPRTVHVTGVIDGQTVSHDLSVNYLG